MSKFSFYIEFNKDETFKSVILNSGKTYTPEAWNKIFTSLKPASVKTGTNVKNDNIETDYDPD
jgi:hypothetical protein